MADTPSAELRRAAATLRQLADVATPGPWERDEYAVHGADGTYVTAPWTSDETDPDLDLIAAMGPTVAAALSDLLDAAAETLWDGIVGRHHQYWRLALTVARAVNAEETDRA